LTKKRVSSETLSNIYDFFQANEVSNFREGKAEGKAEMIKDCFKAGLSVEILSQISGFPIEKVKAILSI